MEFFYNFKGLGILILLYLIISAIIFFILKKNKNVNILTFITYDLIVLMILTSIYFYLSLSLPTESRGFIKELSDISTPFTLFLTFTALLISIFTLIKTNNQFNENKDYDMINTLIKNNFDMFINRQYISPIKSDNDLISFEKRIKLLYTALEDSTSETGYKLSLLKEMFTEIINKNETSLIIKAQSANLTSENEKKRIIKLLKSDSKEYSVLIYAFLSLVDVTLYNKLDSVKTTPIKTGTITELGDEFWSDFLDKFNSDSFQSKWNEQMNPKLMNHICSSVFNENYTTFGHFYRHLHRIVKYINNHVKDESLKKEYLGILRAQYSDIALITIFYNCIYVKDGYGLGYQLLYSDFFGTKEDFDNKLSHFSEDLFLNTLDKNILFELFLSNSKKPNNTPVSTMEAYIKAIDNC